MKTLMAVGVGNGVAGACPGVDADLCVAQKWAAARAFAHREMLSGHGGPRRKNVACVWRYAARTLAAGDLLFLYFSGHGMQSAGGPEPDGREEFLCLEDGFLLDRSFEAELRDLLPGVRVFAVLDCCHAAGMVGGLAAARAMGRRAEAAARAAGKEFLGICACEEGRVAYGDEAGGGWLTRALDQVWTGRAGRVGYGEWLAAACAAVDGAQKPVIVGGGPEWWEREALS